MAPQAKEEKQEETSERKGQKQEKETSVAYADTHVRKTAPVRYRTHMRQPLQTHNRREPNHMYGENTKFTCTRCANDDEWRIERNKSIGGSDVAAILGISKWKSPAAVYVEKAGIDDQTTKKDAPSAVMEFGNMMEPVIAERFKEEHPDILVRRANAILRPIDRPWAHASLDYECREPDGKWGVLEIKCAASEAEWKDGVVAYYMVQGQHYLSVTGRDYVWFCVFFRDSCKIASFRVERDEELIKHIDTRVDEFWENIVSKCPPKNVSGTKDESSALAKIYANPQDRLKSVTDANIESSVMVYETIAAQIKSLEKKRRQLSDAICRAIGDDRGITLPNAKRRVVWVRTERKSYDTARLAKDHPDIAEQYEKITTTSGGLRITKTK